MARYLVTGIAGFIGSSLAHELLEQGHEVTGIDNLSTGSLQNIADIRSDITFHQADIRELSSIEKAFAGVEYVLHQAALASVPRSVMDPIASHESNINGTLNVLVAARNAGVHRIVYAASSSAYGNQAGKAKQEDMLPQPLSPYATQKLSCEYYLQSFCKVYGMEGICLRYFNIFGPRQAADSPYSGVIAAFVRKMMSGETPTINGDGLISRDFTFVQNAVQANLLACTAPSTFANGRVYNVGTGQSHTLNSLYDNLARILDFEERPNYGPVRPGDVEHSLADISRAQTELGYVPRANFEAGLLKTVEWYLANAQSGVSVRTFA
jgi:nucleoside-diphosphate-sugar epimerase